MIGVTRVAQGDSSWATRVLPFLEAETDPVRDLLLWADVASSLGAHSTIWLAERDDQAEGLAFAFPMWPTTSALGVKGRTPDVERELLAAVRQDGLTGGFVICEAAQLQIYGEPEGLHREHQMVLAAGRWETRALTGVRPGRFDELDAFYRRCGAGAWNPLQFETGPFFVAEQAGRVVAAAGTHFAYPGLAQVGNVLTDPDFRGRGHAARVTAAVVQSLVEAGYPVVSLFVAVENAPAIAIYQRLGFEVLRTLECFTTKLSAIRM